ncbi:hypothetical protein RchiOBHm_Chr1g0313831 [Rosa chinensis]|uniref:Uncharacterized protein n=1 Tax=Rosa chinensis TaxID=74649 RepID=A0A2P6S6Z5_ROSCH|nr:hypothetical protein RchiOBHm_Chr1g0313831 [Rosa chinensis]
MLNDMGGLKVAVAFKSGFFYNIFYYKWILRELILNLDFSIFKRLWDYLVTMPLSY